MDATLRLIAQHAIRAADVERVEVGGNQSNVNTLFRHRPTTGLEAKFSMEFAVAILLVDGKAGLGQFTDESVKRSEVQDLVGRVSTTPTRSSTPWARTGRFRRCSRNQRSSRFT